MKRLALSLLVILVLLVSGVASADTSYTVQRGDTLYRIALNFGVSMQEIMDANGISNPDVIYVGQVLTIPTGDDGPTPTPTAPTSTPTAPPTPTPTPPGEAFNYTVQPGDTIARISRRFNVSIQAIIDANNLVNPDRIFVGQQLLIPGSGRPTPTPSTPTPTPPPSTPTPTPPPGGVTIHVVERGDTTASIARRYGVSINAIVVANNLANPNFIYVGQRLRIPIGEPDPTPTPTPPPTATQPPSTPTPTAVPTATPVPPTATPTPTPVPPTPTPTPTPQPVVNVLPNSSFEDGWYNLNGIPELQVPVNWRFAWDEGGNAFGTTWLRPESRVLPSSELPAFERPLFVYDGFYTVKVFKGYGPVSFRMSTDVNLQPGLYELTVQVFPDMVVDVVNGQKIFATDPRSAEISLFGNNASTGFLLPVIGRRNVVTHQFRVDQEGVVTVGAAMRGRYGLQSNGFFTDAWSLYRIGE